MFIFLIIIKAHEFLLNFFFFFLFYEITTSNYQELPQCCKSLLFIERNINVQLHIL